MQSAEFTNSKTYLSGIIYKDYIGIILLQKGLKVTYSTSRKNKHLKTYGLLERRAQRLQYPLIKEYALNHIRDPIII